MSRPTPSCSSSRAFPVGARGFPSRSPADLAAVASRGETPPNAATGTNSSPRSSTWGKMEPTHAASRWTSRRKTPRGPNPLFLLLRIISSFSLLPWDAGPLFALAQTVNITDIQVINIGPSTSSSIPFSCDHTLCTSSPFYGSFPSLVLPSYYETDAYLAAIGQWNGTSVGYDENFKETFSVTTGAPPSVGPHVADNSNAARVPLTVAVYLTM